MKALTVSLLLAALMAAAGCCHTTEPGGGFTLEVQPVCVDTGQPPPAWVFEAVVWHSGMMRYRSKDVGDLLRHARPDFATYHVEQLAGGVATWQVPAFAAAEECGRSFEHENEPAWNTRAWVYLGIYIMGYELLQGPVIPPVEEVVDGQWAKRVEAKPWDNNSGGFGNAWSVLSSDLSFKPRSEAWARAAADPAQRGTICGIYAWWVARYEAAVRQNPELADEEVPARNIRLLRQRLAQMTGR
jgi:hypothetical protein